MLAKSDDIAAQQVLAIVGVTDPSARERAVIRAYCGLVKGAVQEWVREGTLTRHEVRLLLVEALVTIVRDVLPRCVSSPEPATP